MSQRKEARRGTGQGARGKFRRPIRQPCSAIRAMRRARMTKRKTSRLGLIEHLRDGFIAGDAPDGFADEGGQRERADFFFWTWRPAPTRWIVSVITNSFSSDIDTLPAAPFDRTPWVT